MIDNIAQILIESPFVAIFVVFLAGFLATLSSCSLVRIPIVFGFVAGTSASKRKSFITVLFFVLGITLSYTALGVLIGIIGDLTPKLINATKYIYGFFGVFMIIIGLLVIGLFKIKLRHLHINIADRFKNVNYLGAFIFGIVLAFIEMPTCPCCAPVLIIIAGTVISKGSILYSILIFLSFSIGQSIPTLIIGTSTSLAKYLTPKIAKYEGYFRLVAGNVLIIFGIYFVIIA